MTYAEVILPLPLYSTFTYSIPDNLQSAIGVGFRVLVPFGRKKFYTGIVTMLHNQRPGNYEVKDIVAVLDNDSILRHPQMKFWQWISDYYLCPVGEVYKAAVPAGMKVESETRVSANPDFIDTDGSMTERETVVYDMLLAKERLTPAEIAKATGYKSVETVVARLIDKEAVFVTEKIVDNYRPKTEVCVALRAEKGDNKTVEDFFSKVKQAKKQEAALLAYLDLSGWMKRNATPKEVTKDALIKRAEVSLPIINAMVAKGIFSLYKKEVNRFHLDNGSITALNPLSEPQQKAYDEIIETFKEQNITLLHGVTSSGKTEIYTHLIDNALKRGLQALYLVPEIALTTQLTQRLHKNFGDRLLIYHSKFSDNERVDIWKKLLHSNEPCVVIGVRSSVFLPFGKLGIVIVDEEHETSYKSDSMPKYHAREVAVHLAEMTDACVVMGSATPSLEANYRAQQGIYKKYVLSERIGDAVLPEVQIVDMRQELAGGNSSIFSRHLETAIADRLEKRQQVMLFLNRRGISGFVSCRACGYVMKCPHCDVSLSEHRQKMVCHYCGYEEPKPSVCPKCQSRYLFGFKAGTQQVEDSLRLRFPEARILRMDADTTKKKDDYEKILAVFANRDADILIGTQMIVKGHDFPGVTLMGVLAADLSFLAADYRSGERTFQLLVQAVGRAGRGSVAGEAVIQTYQPDHYSVVYAAKQDYDGFYQEEMAYRKLLGYPPAAHMLAVLFTGKNEKETLFWAEQMLSMLRRQTRERKDLVIIGPAPASIGRINDMFRQIAYFKSPDETLLMRLRGWMELFCQKNEDKMRSLLVYYDMDPVHGY